MASQVESSDWLQWIERLVGASTVTARPAEHARALPRALYYCCLDDQPDFLVPARFLRSPHGEDPSDCNRTDPKWILNPLCFFKTPDSIEFDEQHFACNSSGYRVVWVRDAAAGSVMPYWLGPELLDTLARVEQGEALDEAVSRDTLFALKLAAVLIDENSSVGLAEERRPVTSKSRQQFLQNGYVPLGHLVHPFHLAALRRYYRYHLRHGNFQLGDSQTGSRYVAFNEPVARFFHHQLTARISEIVGEAVKPSYCYFSSYAEGSLLAKHTDREQCEFGISLCIDYSPEADLATPWPLRLHIKGGEAQIFQALGDAILYRGREIPHSRTRLAAGHSSTSIFFHFVRQDFSGPLN
ncbi:MAG: hypothetical protein ABSE92_02330 [Terriglobales bacterium]|jgi:hypothetical protein